MAFFKSLHPRQFFTVLHRIDQQSQVSVEPVRPSQRVFFTLFFVGLCLLLVNYAKFNGAFFWFYELFQSGDSLSLQRAFMYLRRDPFYELYLHAWWGFIHVLGFFILPALFIRCYLKERLNQHGLQWGAVHRHLKWYLVLVAPILCGVVVVSFRDDFASHYPFYRNAGRSWLDFLLWESIYIGQFVVLEFFFRGFMLNALRPAMGAQGILVMCLPYLMLHFSKPWIEATGALFFGLFLGILALHSRSIWGGVGVHVSIALAMDVAA
ncbi:MAG: CPBP family intramembrane metalloprotease [Ketobacter sp.]|nr:MAG: CPBP family intramembrane metalloprotease [Ketobacter sp.]